MVVGFLVTAIGKAKRKVEIVVFRFDDHPDIEHALAQAARRGVTVQALVANTNRGGEKNLREARDAVTHGGGRHRWFRTDNDFPRHRAEVRDCRPGEETFSHWPFNFTHLSISGDAAALDDRVRAAGSCCGESGIRLFEADTKRRRYKAGLDTFLVSPANARQAPRQLSKRSEDTASDLIRRVSDPEMIGQLMERQDAGVEVRVIGRMTRKKIPDTRSQSSEARLACARDCA